MILTLPELQFAMAPKDVRLFFVIYKKLKGYNTPTIELQHLLELLRALTHNPQVFEGNIKTNVVDLDSLIFGHDSDEPIDDAFYETVKAIQKALYAKRIEKHEAL